MCIGKDHWKNASNYSYKTGLDLFALDDTKQIHSMQRELFWTFLLQFYLWSFTKSVHTVYLGNGAK